MKLWPAALAGLGLLLVTRNQRMFNSEPKIATLRASVQALVRELMSKAASAGIALDVVQAFRSEAEQEVIYAQGRTAPGPIVSNAPPGSSYHEWGLAFDVAIDKGGNPTWPNTMSLWNQIGAIGESLGLTWGGRFPSPDYGHFELRMPGIGPGQSPAPLGPVT